VTILMKWPAFSCSAPAPNGDLSPAAAVSAFLTAFLLGLTLLSCSASSKTATLGKTAPDFTLNDLDGNPLQLSHYRGKVILLRFWSEWCTNCKLEMTEVEFSYQKLAARGFVVLAVYVKAAKESSVLELARELKLTFPVLIDKSGDLASRYRVTGLPTNFIIDRKGVIREKVLGEGLNRKELSKLTAPYL
jgi:peroxiredoxin